MTSTSKWCAEHRQLKMPRNGRIERENLRSKISIGYGKINLFFIGALVYPLSLYKN